MEPGDTVTYEGAAQRVAGDEQVKVEGTFTAVEQRKVGGELRWVVEDTRLGDFKQAAGDEREFNPDVHRYLLPASYSGTGDRPVE